MDTEYRRTRVLEIDDQTLTTTCDYQEAIDQALEREDRRALGRLYLSLAYRFEEARDAWGQANNSDDIYGIAIMFAEKAEDWETGASACNNMGVSLMAIEKSEDASDSFRKAAQFGEKAGAWDIVATAYYNLGLSLRASGDTKQALDLQEKAIEYGTRAEEWPAVAGAYWEMAKIHKALGRQDDRMSAYHKAMECSRKAEQWGMVTEICDEMACAYQEAGEISEAIDCFCKAIEFGLQAEKWSMVAIINNNLATCLRSVGETDYVVRCLRGVIAYGMKAYDSKNAGVIYRDCLINEDVRKESAKDLRLIGNAYCELGIIFQESENPAEAVRAFEEAIVIGEKIEDGDLIASARNNRDEALRQLEESEESDEAADADSEVVDTDTPSHFDDIGFEIETKEQYDLMISYWMRNSLWRGDQEIKYGLYIPNDNIQVWLFARNGEILNTIPFYEGSSRIEIRIEEKLVTRNNIRGMISGWVNPSSTEDCPLIFDVPDYWLVHEWIREEEIYHVGLTAFSEGALFYENAEAFREASPKNIQMREKGGDAPIPVRGYAPNHFIPTGRFSEVYEGSEPTSTAMFAGAVKDLRLITNEKTKCSFYWMNVETLFGELDVVCSKKGLNAEPHIGGILDGYFYLVGRIHLD